MPEVQLWWGVELNITQGRSEGLLLFENETVIFAKVAILMLRWGIIADISLWWNTYKQIYTARNARIIEPMILKQKMSGVCARSCTSTLISYVDLILHQISRLLLTRSPAVIQANADVGAHRRGSSVTSGLRLLRRRRQRHIFKTSDRRIHLQTLHSPRHGPVEGKYLYLSLGTFSSTSHLQEGKELDWRRSRPCVKLHRWAES